VEEVAMIISIPENTVKTRLFHARKKLAELLKNNGIDRGWP
jgi:RNA polymerase sigma-70 factor (ECF subfamily)